MEHGEQRRELGVKTAWRADPVRTDVMFVMPRTKQIESRILLFPGVRDTRDDRARAGAAVSFTLAHMQLADVERDEPDPFRPVIALKLASHPVIVVRTG